ncbi:MAG: TRAP transporter large permease subunit [Gammaproteobacteria bacterium]|nr:TRAP transporter large permease subunit [Gammaproteobacteria bacterium]
MSAWVGLAALMLVLLALRQNLLVILGLVAAYAHLVFGDGRLTDIAVDVWDAANKDVLLSVPLYMLAGNVMARGVMAERLIRLLRALSGPLPGGLAMATVLACALFAAVSGSGTVTMLAIGSVMYPALLAAGHRREFALGALCSAGTLGVIIPPSIPLILYGVMTQTSIADLFLAGVGPGLLLTALLTLYAGARNRQLAGTRWVGTEIRAALAAAFWALLMPVIVLGGIYSGHFTPTESAAVAAAYAIVVEMFVYRELDVAGLRDVVAGTTALLGALFPVLMFALSLTIFLTYAQVPDAAVAWVAERVTSPLTFLVGVNLLLLAVGSVMDIGSAILVLAPLLAPLAVAQGIDPVHFGIIMVVNLEIGYLTPPVGMNLIVATSAYGEDFRLVCRAVVPFVLLMLTGLVVIAYWPALSLFLVR